MNIDADDFRVLRVLIADDQALVRGALAALLNLEPDLSVVSQVGSGSDVLEAARSQQADIALLDIEMPGMDGIHAAAALAEHLPTCAPMIVTTFGRPGYLRRALEAGARGFVVKDTPPAELAQVVRQVCAGEVVVDPKLAAESMAGGANPLTEREREVLRKALGGAPVKAIARAVALSPGTVRNYLSQAMAKTGATTRVEAARLAQAKGWL